MNRIKLVAIIGFYLLCVLASGQSNTICHNRNTSFKGGEKLVYELYYNWNFIWIPAGTLEMTVEERKDHYFIKALGKTHDSYNWFFKVYDVFTCEIDKITLKPRKFSRNIEEGDYRIKNDIYFNHETDKVTSYLTVNNGKTETYRFDNSECMLDLLSLSYNLRNLNVNFLIKSGVIYTDLIFDEKKYLIPVKYKGREKKFKVSGLGSIDVIKISPDLISGNVFSEGSTMLMYVSDDMNKIPVMIESPIKVGSVKAILKSWKNLRHPFDLKRKN
jgi:hypothetical protein